MTRTDNDSWDLASSVGATATMVATVRALATKAPDPLIHDPFAEPLARAVGIDLFTRVLDGDASLADFSDDPRFNLDRTVDLIAVRTRFFDDFFIASADAGIRQAVILASGLDSRPYRLPWPTGTVVYEVDLPDVMEFKSTTLTGLGARPSANHRVVAVDLRDDWPKALRDKGFNIGQPTAWSAEGLLVYLPPEAQDRLFDEVTGLSAAGSRLATEYHPDGAAGLTERSKAVARRFSEQGLNLDLSDLVYHGDRNPVTDYLAARGWQVSTQTRVDLFTTYGRVMPDDDTSAPARNTIAVTATRE
ncbi:MAG TPA: class I SAM-dependent methyltransferase [Mycobacterium sp.]|nr:class I SAM-dependent methyltransferase [Mycobacterium sp.]